MPRTQKTYTRLYLKSMKRADIQAHAKRHNIKANGKTKTIIEELLGRIISEEEPPALAVAKPRTSRVGARKNQVSVSMVEPVVPNDESKSRIGPERSVRSKAARPGRVTPYPSRMPSLQGDLPGGKSSSESSRSFSPERPAQKPRVKMTDKTTASRDPMRQTDSDVRVVRRQLAKMIDEQASFNIEDIKEMLAFSMGQLGEVTGDIYTLTCRREAIEQTVVTRMKQDRILWDGGATLEAGEDADRWYKFVEESWNGPLQLKGRYELGVDEDESEGGDNEYDEDDDAEAGNGQVLDSLPNQDAQETPDDDPDDMYL